jgi:hypothetical protein
VLKRASAEMRTGKNEERHFLSGHEQDINSIAARLFEQSEGASGQATDPNTLSKLKEVPLTAEDVEHNPAGKHMCCVEGLVLLCLSQRHCRLHRL